MRNALIASLCLLPSCSDEPSIQTLAFVEIESVGIEPLCAATQEVITSESHRVADVLGLDDPDVVSVRLGTVDGVHERCQSIGENLAGCVRLIDGEVVMDATLVGFSHELVHALRFQTGGEHAGHFFEEGLAEVIGSGRIKRFSAVVDEPARGPDDVLEGVDAPLEDVPYLIAGHFVAWLGLRHGQEAQVSLYTNEHPGGIAERFETSFGSTLADAATEWSTDAPAQISLAEQCDSSIPLAWEGDQLLLELDLSCDAEGLGPWPTHGGRAVVSQSLCFDVDEAAELEVSFVSESSTVELSLEIVECHDPSSAEAVAPKTVRAMDTQRLPFGPCLWQGSISDEIDAAGPLRLELRR